MLRMYHWHPPQRWSSISKLALEVLEVCLTVSLTVTIEHLSNKKHRKEAFEMK